MRFQISLSIAPSTIARRRSARGVPTPNALRSCALAFDEIVESVLPQQLDQAAIERAAGGGRSSLVETHVGCRSRGRLPVE